MQKDRRVFLKSAGLLTAGAMLMPELLHAKKIKTIGIQLYTLRNELKTDVTGTLAQLAKIGYKDLEGFATEKGHYFGFEAKTYKAMLDDLGLKLRSNHLLTGNTPDTQKGCPDGNMVQNFEKVIENAAIMDQKYIVCAWLSRDERKTIDDYKKIAEQFNKAGEMANKYGIGFAYHNHDFEFKELEGQIPYDILLKHTDPKLVKMELDLYWITKTGKDAVAYFKNYPGRFALCHVKDIAKTEKQESTEVGNGSIDFARIFKHAKTAGLAYFLVEQEHYNKPALECVKVSFDNLKKISF